jgi:F-type H+-transporting ATPase subunit delta
MKDRKLASRYARALLAALPGPREAQAASEFLVSLGRAMEESAPLRAMLMNPGVPRSERRRMLGSLAERVGLARHVVTFLHTVVDKGRVAELPLIARVFDEERERAQGIVAATVSSAKELPSDLTDRLRRSLERLTGRTVRMSTSVDPSLIGGVVTRVGSTVYDGSVRTSASAHQAVQE